MLSQSKAFEGRRLVASHIEVNYSRLNCQVPSKRNKAELLVTNKANGRAILLQARLSRDYATNKASRRKGGMVRGGWWTLSADSIAESTADFWVFVLRVPDGSIVDYVVIPRTVLYERLARIHRTDREINAYFGVTKDGRCLDTRGLKKKDFDAIERGEFCVEDRDFSQYLNNWAPIEALNEAS